VLLHEVLIVLPGLLAIILVELGTEILLRRLQVLFLSVRGVNDGGQRDAKLSLPIRRVSGWFPASISSQYSSTVLAVVGYRGAVAVRFR
jgi:hypothetical protein